MTAGDAQQHLPSFLPVQQIARHRHREDEDLGVPQRTQDGDGIGGQVGQGGREEGIARALYRFTVEDAQHGADSESYHHGPAGGVEEVLRQQDEWIETAQKELEDGNGQS